MKKLYELVEFDKYGEPTLEYLSELYHVLDETLGKKMILRDLLSFGWNALYTPGEQYLGYDEEHFTERQLDMVVKVSDSYFEDADGYPCVVIEFL